MEKANSPNAQVHRYQLKVNTATRADDLYLSKIYEGIIYSQAE